MGNLERVATWGTQSTEQNTNNRKHNTIQKTKKISTTDSTTKNNAVNPGVLHIIITLTSGQEHCRSE
jgi:hypothetical protein